jgi:hypothetical protein
MTKPVRPRHASPTEYFYSAQRHLNMATYHCVRLEMISDQSVSSGLSATREYESNHAFPPAVAVIEDDDRVRSPHVATQCYFEGLINSVAGAVDRLAEGIRVALGQPVGGGDSLVKLLKEASDDRPCVTGLRAFEASNLYRHMRFLRNQIVHHYYDKGSGPSEYVLHTDAPGCPEYDGSTELVTYGREVLLMANELADILHVAVEEYSAAEVPEPEGVDL